MIFKQNPFLLIFPLFFSSLIVIAPAGAQETLPTEPTPAVAQEPTEPALEVTSEKPAAKKEKKKKEKKVKEEAPVMAPEVVSQTSVNGSVLQCNGIYRAGEAAFSPRTRVRFSVGEAGIEIAPVKRGAASWLLPYDKVRGATAVDNGLWFYWFEDGDLTKAALFEVDNRQQELATQINSLVTKYHEGSYQQKFESYKDKALKEAN